MKYIPRLFISVNCWRWLYTTTDLIETLLLKKQRSNEEVLDLLSQRRKYHRNLINKRIQLFTFIVLSNIYRTQGEHASVYLSFMVPPTGESFVPFYETESTRWAFPEEDIFITSIAFHGVEAGGHIIPYHDALHHSASESPHPLVYHHTILHQGSMDETQLTWKHFSELDHSTWSHGAIMYGTTVKNTSFGDYGLRLRKDAPIFTCMHAKNSKSFNVEFIALWEIEYEILDSGNPDPRSMVIGWFSIPPTFNGDFENENYELKERRLIEQKIPLAQDVKLMGWILHHHHWLNELVIKLNNKVLFDIGVNDKNHPMPANDEEVNWLRDDDGSSSSSIGIPIFKGEYLFIDVIAEKPTERNNGPLGLSLFFTVNDGSDTLVTMHDLFSSQPQIRDPQEKNLKLMSKVESWNNYVTYYDHHNYNISQATLLKE